MSTALAFNEVSFSPVVHNQQPWIRSSELAQALGYSSEKSVSNLYARKSDEFSNDMSVVINLMTGSVPVETRIFSLRGCHLLAMFARTPVAKAFRVWVLDVLETLNKAEQRQQPALDTTTRLSKRTDPERKALTAIINTWVGMAPIHYAAARVQVNSHFGVASVDSLTVAQVKEAIQWVQGKIDELPKALPETTPAMPDYFDRQSLTNRMEQCFAAMRYHAQAMRENETEIFEIIRKMRGHVLNVPDKRRSAFVNMGIVRDDIFYTIDHAVKAAEFHAKTMCVMSQM
ncbi:hypothetical protein LJC46_04240 [Desulfovibrio sp. OttesenSCG-928-G15]|nr:hypothetical protein [Desulfovibrio sp. OttesenSCG-928-G15]